MLEIIKNKFIIRNYLLHSINVSSYNLRKKKKIIHKHTYHECPRNNIVKIYITNIYKYIYKKIYM